MTVLSIVGFQGEVPRIHPRFLGQTQAQISLNAKMDRGSLSPYRRPKDILTLGANAQTIYRHNGTWLSWNADVDAVPGPVATTRLYHTGDGVPKIYISGTTYNLAVPRPVSAPTIEIVSLGEFLVVDGTDVRLQNGITRTTSGSVGSVNCQVKVSGNTATVRMTHAGMTTAQTQTLINNLKYRQVFGGDVKGLKIVRIRSIQDNGGKTFDAYKNPLGSDTREMTQVGTTVNVNGTTLTYTFSGETHDSTNVSGQNDPPTLSVTGLNPSFTTGGADATLFSGAAVSTIEGGQLIIAVEVEIQGLANGAIDRDQALSTIYVYTYVTAYDEESEPSPISRRVQWSPGVTYRLKDFATPAGGLSARNIDRIRIYRSETGASGQTDFYFIAEATAIPGSVLDIRDEMPAQNPLPSLDFNTPPDGLAGLTAMPNGMMAAFSGRRLYFCEPWIPHAWPDKYVQTVDYDIVGIESFGSSLAVLTKGQPYVAQGTHPENILMEKLEVNFPCVSKRSCVDMGGYVVYASHKGLVTIDNSGARIISEPIFTEYQWKQMDPTSFICGQYEGRYVIAHEDAWGPFEGEIRCTLIDMSGQTPYIVRVKWNAVAFFYDIESSRLFYLHDNNRDIREFDNETGAKDEYRWRSKQFILPGLTTFSCILVESDGGGAPVAVKIFADGRLVDTVTAKNNVKRIRDIGRLARTWEVEVKGKRTITAIHLAQSPEEIAMSGSVV